MKRIAGALILCFLVGCGGGDPKAESDTKKAKPVKAKATPTPVPDVLPEQRVVAFYGNPADDELGILGIGSPDRAGRKLLKQAKAYERKTRKVKPAMELLAVIANADAGDDGMYRRRESNKVIRRYLKAARKINALLILDIQPGKADFFTETVALKRWLKEPDVSLAIDPEWRIQGSQVPGKVIGSVSSREVNATTAWLDQLTEKHNLPQKLFVIHQFTNDMVQDKDKLQERKNLAIILNADGFGGREVKIAKYREFTKGPADFHDGFKLFYKEDVGLMKPAEVIGLATPPDFVVYE